MEEVGRTSQGFTLVEMLIVVAIIATLAVTIFVAVHPGQRVKDDADVRRHVDVESILTAIHQYEVDNSGNLPAGLTTGMVQKQLGTATTGCAIATGGCAVAENTECVDLSTPLAKYLQSIPVDPSGTDALTKYSVVVDSNNIVTVQACAANTGTISQSR